MIGVILIFQSICQKTHLLKHHVCVSLIHARIQADKLLITAQPIRNLRTPASTEMNKRVLIAGVPYPLSPISLPFSLPPYPLSMPGLKMGLGNHVLV